MNPSVTMATKRITRKKIGRQMFDALKRRDPIKAYADGLQMHMQLRRIEIMQQLNQIAHVEGVVAITKESLQDELRIIDASLKVTPAPSSPSSPS